MSDNTITAAPYVGAVDYTTDQNMGPSTQLKKDGNLGQDSFLELLVTQLQYQDPLDPMSNEDFIAQTAQFQSLEQLIGISNSLSNNNLAQELGSASALIGTEVKALNTSAGVDGTETELVEGLVEKVIINDGKVRLVVDGTEIGLESIQEVLPWYGTLDEVNGAGDNSGDFVNEATDPDAPINALADPTDPAAEGDAETPVEGGV